MKKQNIKGMMVGICVFAAGICYSLSSISQADGGRSDGMLVLSGTTMESMDGSAVGTGGNMISGHGVSVKGMPGTGGSGEEMADEGVLGGDASDYEAESEKILCYVHIDGEVNKPGVYELEEGSRIFQAVEMAGGFTDEAVTSYLNLAQKIADGMKIVVPSREELESAMYEGVIGVSGVTEESTPGSDGKININTADKETLMTLRGIGEAKAEDIIRYRREHGPFGTIEDIMNISGIKEAAFEKIKDHITV